MRKVVYSLAESNLSKKSVNKIDSYKIGSLSEFVSLISKFPSDNYFYRGEPSIYRDRQASAFRPYDGSFSTKREFPFIKMSEAFYREIGHRLTDIEKNNFLAFSQHYGLPTNLIDVTSSPLVALYFACKENQDNAAAVYIFDDNFIDITSILDKYPNVNILEHIASCNDKEIADVVTLFKAYYKKHKHDLLSYLYKLIDSYNTCFEDLLKKKERISKRYSVIDILDKFRDDPAKISLDVDYRYPFTGNYSTEVIAFLILLRKFMENALSVSEVIYTLNFLPNFIYKPLLTFERARAQRGFFIYQSYFSYIDPAYNYPILAQQLISHKVCIRIRNPKIIERELDNIGINQMTLFQDYDSTAKYIFEKYT